MAGRKKAFLTVIAVLTAGSLLSAPVFAAGNQFRIDETNWTAQDWASIAMTNDDTVDTGAVIRKEASADSEAAGYLYRGAGAKVLEKGGEWTLVESGRVKGYVKNEFLTFGEEARGLAAHYGEQGVSANWNDVTVFAGENGASEEVLNIKDGTVLGMVEDNGHWIAVQKDEKTAGYVSEEDVTRVLLVDTAVPVEGEDEADVIVTLTAAEVAAMGGTADAAASSAAEASQEAAGEEVFSAEAGDENFAGEASGDASDGSCSTPEDGTNVPVVSDDPYIQSLYEAYMAAQNAAMNCTSAEDAQAKAAAATEAWNAYVAACSGTAVSAGADAGNASTGAVPQSSTEDAEEDDLYEEDTLYAEDDASYEDDEEESAEESWTDVDADDSEEEGTSSDAAAAAAASKSGLYGGASDLDLLAAIIWCEAGNQSYDGMVAVGQVVMNRVKSASFPNTIAEVLNSPGQFTPSSSGTLQAALNAGVNATCYAAAADALNGAAPVPGTPLYFNTHSGSYKLGAHYFS